MVMAHGHHLRERERQPVLERWLPVVTPWGVPSRTTMNATSKRPRPAATHLPRRSPFPPGFPPAVSWLRPLVRGLAPAVVLAAFLPSVAADDFMGEYRGEFLPDSVVKLEASAKVIAEGDGYYRVVITAPGREGLDGAAVELYGREFGPEVGLFGRAGGYHWNGTIKKGLLVASTDYGLSFRLNRMESKAPGAGLKPPEGAVVLLAYEPNQKPDLGQWTNPAWQATGDGAMQCAPGKGETRTRREFGPIARLHLEFKLPLEPRNRGQGRANSGVYIADRYEVQVLDSFGLTHTSGDCGGLYGLARARVNASLPPGTWQTYDIRFEPARLNAEGKVAEKPRITVVHNGITIHDRQEIDGSEHRLKGPLQLQDHGHPIEYRNIWLLEGQ